MLRLLTHKLTQKSQTFGPFLGVVVPFEGFEFPVGQIGESVDDVSAKIRVQILREIFALRGSSVLRPVGVVTDFAVTIDGLVIRFLDCRGCRCCGGWRRRFYKKRKKKINIKFLLLFTWRTLPIIQRS